MSDAKRLQAKGIRLFQNHNFDEAMKTFQEAIQAFEAEGDAVSVAEQQVNLGLCHRALEQYDAAIEWMEKGLATFREKEDKLREAQALGNMALVYTKQGNNEQATTYYREAAAIFKAEDDEDNYAETLQAMADMQFKSGDLVQAATTFEIALEHIRNPNMRQKLAKQLLVVKNRVTGERKLYENTETTFSRRSRRLRSQENEEE